MQNTCSQVVIVYCITLRGFAINIICVIADGGRNGLCAGNSVPEGG